MLSELLQEFIGKVLSGKDTTFSDRLSCYYTTWILAFWFLLVSAWYMFGSAIMCWFPAYYRSWWMEYALDYCLVSNTYFLPFYKQPLNNFWDYSPANIVQIPTNVTERDERTIGYYQWVPILLAIDAILFYIPLAMWRSLYDGSGVKVKEICDYCSKSEISVDVNARKKAMTTLAKFVDHSRMVYHSSAGNVRNLQSGMYVTCLYLFIKFIFAVNAIGQFFLLQAFVGMNSTLWGVHVLRDMLAGREWVETSHFPRVTLCDFKVKVMGSLHRHTLQCVLMINMFNEKIFVFLWFWFLLVSIVSLVSFIRWVIRCCFLNRHYVEGKLMAIDGRFVASLSNRRTVIHHFCQESLKPDGVFLIRLISQNAGLHMGRELLGCLWADYKKRHHLKEANGMSVPLMDGKGQPTNGRTDNTPVAI